MIDSFVAQIAEAQEAQEALAEHERLTRLAAGLEGLKAAKARADELDALWAKLCETQTELTIYVAEAAERIPTWRQKFAAAHEALLAVVGESDTAQAPLLLAGDSLRRAYKLERQIQELNGQPHNPTTQRMWESSGGNNPDLDPLRGLPGDGWAAWFGGKFLYRPQIGLRHFFRG